jgi:hypothetical protein
MNEDGLVVTGTQKKLIDDLTRLGSNCRILVYGVRYLFELPNTYPCVNFMDMLYSHPIITENDDDVYTYDNKKVVGLTYDVDNNIPLQTPPISIDRSATTSFKTVLGCLKLHTYLMNLEKTLLDIGKSINSATDDAYYLNRQIYTPASNVLIDLKNLYKMYLSGGIITSLVSFTDKYIFQNIITRLETFVTKFAEDPSVNTVKRYAIDEFYGYNYKNFVDRITNVFNHPSLQVFRDLDNSEFTRNYFLNYNKNTRFTRPISEQCFIAMKYSYDEGCWVFTYPDIKHFHGIGNTFYIKDKLKGNEVFKFFILYTDNEDTSHTNIEEFDFSDVFDFDKFSTEVDQYKGYIRYWNVENHLRKISQLLYSNDSTEYQIQVLSQILNEKLDGKELLDLYPTDMNYEASNASTDNIDNYTETSSRAPFALNFLFYTINMMYDNKDQLLAYLVRKLVHEDFSNRYSDIDIASVLTDTLPVNYSNISVINPSGNIVGDDDRMIFYGVPAVFNSSNSNTVSSPYNYTFHVYDTSTEYPLIKTDCGVNKDYHIDNIQANTIIDASYDIKIVKKVYSFIAYCADFINFIETRFTYSFDICNQLYVFIKKLTWYYSDINEFIENNTGKFIYADIWLNNFKNAPGGFITALSELESLVNSFRNSIGDNKNIYTYINNDFLQNFHRVYESFGFDDYATYRIKALYKHLSKINDAMNLFEFEEWINNIDLDGMKYLYSIMSNNPNNNPKPISLFQDLYDKIRIFVSTSSTFVSDIRSAYNIISTSTRTTNYLDILQACQQVMTNINKELYSIDSINIHTNPTFPSKPKYIVASITHTNYAGTQETKNLILVTVSEPTSGGYKITEIRQPCSYVFFDGGTLTPNSVTVYDAYGSTLSPSSTFLIDISFTRVGNMCDITNDVNELIDVNNTRLEFQNVHESTVPLDDMVVTVRTGNLNFELLSGNRFYPLECTHEYVLDRSTLLPGSIDIVYTPNSVINKFARIDFGTHRAPEYYVKPVQCLHTQESVGGRYHVGQKLFVKTTDENGFVFPIMVKAIDHSTAQGFVEAIVDYNDSKWFKLDPSYLNQYTQLQVECEVIDDNISNFLNEFSNSEYVNYQVIPFKNNMTDDIYTLPGDPIYVQDNADYVHTRLSWFFGDVPNRFIDETHKRYMFVYINSGSIIEDGSMTLFLLNHNFNPLTLPEMYPILREEPNDHSVYAAEQTVFKEKLDYAKNRLELLNRAIAIDKEAYYITTDPTRKQELKLRIEDKELKIEHFESLIKRMEDYINQPENPTTWYNLYAYDDAITYIDNGRAHNTHIPRIHDLIYTDDIEIQMYDWEHKCWLNSSDFTITANTIDGSTLDNLDSYTTDMVQYSLTITPIDPTFTSKKILVYFAYNKSDIYDDVELHPSTFNVRFKPLISTYESNIDSLYNDINIRKHYDTNEIYRLESTYSNDDFSLDTGFHVKRIRRTGKYPDASIVRWNDLTVKSGNETFDFTNFDIYVRFPFSNILQDQYTNTTTFASTIVTDIDSFTEDETITLVCISDSFDGNTSEILFTATTSIVNSEPALTIINSSIHPIPDGTYMCTVAKDPMYKSCGGIVTVDVETTPTENIIDANHQWIKVQNVQYKIIPDEFIIVPNGVTVSTPITIELHNIYKKDDDSTLSPFMYYYDDANFVRYPISNTRRNKADERLNINTTTNTHVKKIKSNYIGVCRYSVQKIPENGLIDFTGYIPTPLSRDRYEFWVNGRYLTDSNLIIVSPTAIQLHDLKSLHNFELIELVDDTEISDVVFPQGSVYMDLEGNTFSSYKLMMMSNARIRYQNIKFRFYFNTKSPLDTYTKNIIPNPNNQDIETDILSYIQIDDVVTSYNELYNIPSINGVPIYHPTTIDLGLIEIPSQKIFDVYDKTWAKEITTNPLFPITHKNNMEAMEFVNINIYSDSNSFKIIPTGICDKFFTVYLSTTSTASINNASTTKKIIPMIRVGTILSVDESYRGLWVHTTLPDKKPIQLK